MEVKNRTLFIISMTLLVAFCYLMISRLLFLAHAERDIGVVRELRAENGMCRRGKWGHIKCTKFFATVDFQSGASRQSFRLDAGYARTYNQPLAMALYRPGDRVPVVFNPNRPEEIFRDKFWDLWGLSLVSLIFQILTLTASFRDPDLSEPVTLKLNRWEG